MTHVSYKGDGPMLQDLLVGRLSFGGLLVPAATPADVVAVLQAGCEKAMLSPGYRESLMATQSAPLMATQTAPPGRGVI